MKNNKKENVTPLPNHSKEPGGPNTSPSREQLQKAHQEIERLRKRPYAMSKKARNYIKILAAGCFMLVVRIQIQATYGFEFESAVSHLNNWTFAILAGAFFSFLLYEIGLEIKGTVRKL